MSIKIIKKFQPQSNVCPKVLIQSDFMIRLSRIGHQIINLRLNAQDLEEGIALEQNDI